MIHAAITYAINEKMQTFLSVLCYSQTMIRILISACLLGEPVRYDGQTVGVNDPMLLRWQKERRLVSICPEVAGGLSVPRERAEILDGDGNGVLAGTARVVDRSGEDITVFFIKGAQHVLETARSKNIGIAILTEKSPSCGSTMIYDGRFSGVRRPGSGVTAAHLEQNGIRVFSQHRISEAATRLARLEASRKRTPI
jgi:uncharacterized protein YbbK (DUF523 family)